MVRTDGRTDRWTDTEGYNIIPRHTLVAGYNKRYAPDTIILKTRSEVKVKVTVTRKWYATLRHPKMYPYTKFGIPTSKNIGDMDRTRKRDGLTDGRTDGRTDGQCDYYMPPKVPLGA